VREEAAGQMWGREPGDKALPSPPLRGRGENICCRLPNKKDLPSSGKAGPVMARDILSAVKNETSPRSRIRQNAGYLTQFPPPAFWRMRLRPIGISIDRAPYKKRSAFGLCEAHVRLFCPACWDLAALGFSREVPVAEIFLSAPPGEKRPAAVHQRRHANSAGFLIE